MGRAPIPVRSLQKTSGGLGEYDVVSVPMTAEERRRVHRLLEIPDGTRLALDLPTGTIMRPGQILHAAGGRAYVVSAMPEEVLLIKPRDAVDAARAGHIIGNLHQDIECAADGIVALWDAPLEARLRRAGFALERTRRPFHGNAAGEHGH